MMLEIHCICCVLRAMSTRVQLAGLWVLGASAAQNMKRSCQLQALIICAAQVGVAEATHRQNTHSALICILGLQPSSLRSVMQARSDSRGCSPLHKRLPHST